VDRCRALGHQSPDRRVRRPARRGRDHDLVVVRGLQEDADRGAAQASSGVGHGLHHLLGIELRHECAAHVAHDLREGEHLAQLFLGRALGGDVEGEGDDSRDRTGFVEHG
jgi:hypothetical protein